MQTTLYFNQGASDKVYTANILPEEDGFHVHFAYGRRGSSLKAGSKTKTPVSREKAQAIFDKLIKAKIAKGYATDENGAVYSSVQSEQSGINCQLLNPVDEAAMIKLCHDNRFIAQEKFDGVRQLLEKTASSVRSINRKGLYTGLSKTISQAVEQLDYDSIILDGEGLGDVNAVFDILHLDGNDLTMLPYVERLSILSTLYLDNNVVECVQTAFSTDEKLALVLEVKKRHGEGVVFKDISSSYEAGRPSSGGNQLKFKFYETATVKVSGHNDDRRSVRISVLDSTNAAIEVGNVTIPPNHDVPDVGQLVEVRYLYAYPNGGSLYQPTYLGVRTDKDSPDTKLQLKYKPT